MKDATFISFNSFLKKKKISLPLLPPFLFTKYKRKKMQKSIKNRVKKTKEKIKIKK